MKKKVDKISHYLHAKFSSARTNSELNQWDTGRLMTSLLQQTSSHTLSQDEETRIDQLKSYGLELSQKEQVISYHDIGSQLQLPVKRIYQNAATKNKWSVFFYLLAKSFDSPTILEIGTNLGVSGQYYLSGILDSKQRNGHLTTIEGVGDLCAIARTRLRQLDPSEQHFEVRHGLYDDVLPGIQQDKKRFDIIFIDGNHHYEPTMKYFDISRELMQDEAMIIFDDINWSAQMKKAWKDVLSQSHHTISLDFYKLGILLFEKNQQIEPKDYRMFLAY